MRNSRARDSLTLANGIKFRVCVKPLNVEYPVRTWKCVKYQRTEPGFLIPSAAVSNKAVELGCTVIAESEGFYNFMQPIKEDTVKNLMAAIPAILIGICVFLLRYVWVLGDVYLGEQVIISQSMWEPILTVNGITIIIGSIGLALIPWKKLDR